MSDKYARTTKPDLRAGSKPKFQSHNTSTFKSKYALDQGRPSSALPKPGLSSLGKIPTGRRIPKPHIESRRSENFGEDPDVQLVPRDGSGWGTGKNEVSDLEYPQDQKRRDLIQSQAPASSARTWSEQAGGLRSRSQLVPTEFPSLGSSGNNRAPEQDGFSLKPASRASWRHGASGTNDPDERDERPLRTSKEFTDYPDMKPAYMKPKGSQPSQRPQNTTGPSILTNKHRNFDAPGEWRESAPVPRDTGRELDKIAELDKDVEGWAGATGEVDYNKKIVFSDDEDGGVTEKSNSAEKKPNDIKRRSNVDFFRTDENEDYGRRRGDEQKNPTLVSRNYGSSSFQSAGHGNRSGPSGEMIARGSDRTQSRGFNDNQRGFDKKQQQFGNLERRPDPKSDSEVGSRRGGNSGSGQHQYSPSSPYLNMEQAAALFYQQYAQSLTAGAASASRSPGSAAAAGLPSNFPPFPPFPPMPPQNTAEFAEWYSKFAQATMPDPSDRNMRPDGRDSGARSRGHQGRDGQDDRSYMNDKNRQRFDSESSGGSAGGKHDSGSQFKNMDPADLMKQPLLYQHFWQQYQYMMMSRFPMQPPQMGPAPSLIDPSTPSEKRPTPEGAATQDPAVSSILTAPKPSPSSKVHKSSADEKLDSPVGYPTNEPTPPPTHDDIRTRRVQRSKKVQLTDSSAPDPDKPEEQVKILERPKKKSDGPRSSAYAASLFPKAPQQNDSNNQESRRSDSVEQPAKMGSQSDMDRSSRMNRAPAQPLMEDSEQKDTPWSNFRDAPVSFGDRNDFPQPLSFDSDDDHYLANMDGKRQGAGAGSSSRGWEFRRGGRGQNFMTSPVSRSSDSRAPPTSTRQTKEFTTSFQKNKQDEPELLDTVNTPDQQTSYKFSSSRNDDTEEICDLMSKVITVEDLSENNRQKLQEDEGYFGQTPARGRESVNERYGRAFSSSASRGRRGRGGASGLNMGSSFDGVNTSSRGRREAHGGTAERGARGRARSANDRSADQREAKSSTDVDRSDPPSSGTDKDYERPTNAAHKTSSGIIDWSARPPASTLFSSGTSTSADQSADQSAGGSPTPETAEKDAANNEGSDKPEGDKDATEDSKRPEDRKSEGPARVKKGRGTSAQNPEKGSKVVRGATTRRGGSAAASLTGHRYYDDYYGDYYGYYGYDYDYSNYGHMYGDYSQGYDAYGRRGFSSASRGRGRGASLSTRKSTKDKKGSQRATAPKAGEGEHASKSELTPNSANDNNQEEWETASESSDFENKQSKNDKRPVPTASDRSKKASPNVNSAASRANSRKSFSGQRPVADRGNQKHNSAAGRTQSEERAKAPVKNRGPDISQYDLNRLSGIVVIDDNAVQNIASDDDLAEDSFQQVVSKRAKAAQKAVIAKKAHSSTPGSPAKENELPKNKSASGGVSKRPTKSAASAAKGSKSAGSAKAAASVDGLPPRMRGKQNTGPDVLHNIQNFDSVQFSKGGNEPEGGGIQSDPASSGKNSMPTTPPPMAKSGNAWDKPLQTTLILHTNQLVPSLPMATSSGELNPNWPPSAVAADNFNPPNNENKKPVSKGPRQFHSQQFRMQQSLSTEDESSSTSASGTASSAKAGSSKPATSASSMPSSTAAATFTQSADVLATTQPKMASATAPARVAPVGSQARPGSSSHVMEDEQISSQIPDLSDAFFSNSGDEFGKFLSTFEEETNANSKVSPGANHDKQQVIMSNEGSREVDGSNMMPSFSENNFRDIWAENRENSRDNVPSQRSLEQPLMENPEMDSADNQPHSSSSSLEQTSKVCTVKPQKQMPTSPQVAYRNQYGNYGSLPPPPPPIDLQNPAAAAAAATSLHSHNFFSDHDQLGQLSGNFTPYGFYDSPEVAAAAALAQQQQQQPFLPTSLQGQKQNQQSQAAVAAAASWSAGGGGSNMYFPDQSPANQPSAGYQQFGNLGPSNNPQAFGSLGYSSLLNQQLQRSQQAAAASPFLQQHASQFGHLLGPPGSMPQTLSSSFPSPQHPSFDMGMTPAAAAAFANQHPGGKAMSPQNHSALQNDFKQSSNDYLGLMGDHAFGGSFRGHQEHQHYMGFQKQQPQTPFLSRSNSMGNAVGSGSGNGQTGSAAGGFQSGGNSAFLNNKLFNQGFTPKNLEASMMQKSAAAYGNNFFAQNMQPHIGSSQHFQQKTNQVLPMNPAMQNTQPLFPGFQGSPSMRMHPNPIQRPSSVFARNSSDPTGTNSAVGGSRPPSVSSMMGSGSGQQPASGQFPMQKHQNQRGMPNMSQLNDRSSPNMSGRPWNDSGLAPAGMRPMGQNYGMSGSNYSRNPTYLPKSRFPSASNPRFQSQQTNLTEGFNNMPKTSSSDSQLLLAGNAANQETTQNADGEQTDTVMKVTQNEFEDHKEKSTPSSEAQEMPVTMAEESQALPASSHDGENGSEAPSAGGSTTQVQPETAAAGSTTAAAASNDQ